MKIFSSLMSALLFGFLFSQMSAAQTSTKVQLSIEAPEQMIDADGNTILPKGGSITDNKHGYSIVASYVRLHENDFLEAKNATIKNNNGQTIKSPSVVHNFKEDKMVLAGPLTYSSKEVQGLSAGKAVAYPDAGKLVALGGVRATNPSFAADTAVFDARAKEAFLYGNYSYAKAKLKGNGASAMLFINFSAHPDNPSISTKPEPKKLDVYLALIEKSSK